MFGSYFKRYATSSLLSFRHYTNLTRNRTRYHSLPAVEDEPLTSGFKATDLGHADEMPATHRWRVAMQRFPFRVVKDVLLTLLALYGVVMLVYPTPICNWRAVASEPARNNGQPDTIDDVMICDCGNSIKEAISRGCKYDELATAWLPAHCRDEELTAEFEKAGDNPAGGWIHWRYPNSTGVLSREEVESYADDWDHARFYSTGRWHVVHCLFYWRKQFRAGFTGVIVEPRFNSMEHIHHCERTLMREDHYTIGTVSGVDLHSSHL